MSELKLCRICLNKDVKLYKLEQCNLKQYYDLVMRNEVLTKDELPRYFCFECAALLHKYHKFKEKCDYGHSTLKKLVDSGFMSYYMIEDIRKNRSDLQPSLDYINYLCRKRIKTINLKYKAETEPLEMENVIVNSLADDEEPFKYEYIPESDHDDDLTVSIPKCENLKTEELNKNDTIFKINTDVPSYQYMKVHHSRDHHLEQSLTDPGYTTNAMNTKSSSLIKPVPNTERKIPAIDFENDSSDTSFSMDVDIVNEDEVTINKKVTRSSKKAKKKDNKKSDHKAKDSVNHKFVGIIREPKGELSKGNWETKLLTEDEALDQFRKKEFDSKYERMEFKCIKCFKGFSKNEMLLRHNKMWHEKGENECRFCHMQFKWKSKLQVHMMNHYYIYKCLRCGLQFYLKNGAVFHDGHHNGVIHKCKHCGEEYTHISTYYTHLRTSHRNAHACVQCGATFVSQTGVVVHMKRKHVMHPHPSHTEEPSTNIYCQKCDISFVSQSAYDEHLSQSKLHEEENKEFKRTRRKRREILANAARCIHCNKKFKSKSEVKTHIALEHPGQNKVERVVCEICGAVLSSAYIDIHMNRHTRKKVYPCQTCGKEFLCVTSHNTHQLTHSGEKPHACPICPKRFGLKGHMEVHYKRVHLKEPYPKSGPKLCPICSKPFAYASDMDVHYRRVHLKEPYPKRTYNRKNRNRQPIEVPLYASLPK